jgi:hypothetical protein
LRIWGTFKLFVGVLAAVSALFGIMQGLNRVPESLWGPVTLASAALLALEGVFELFSQTRPNVLIALAAMVPIGIAGLFHDWSPRVWILALMLAFLEWTIRRLSKATGQNEIGTLVFSVILGAALANTTGELIRFYWNAPSVWTLGQIAGFMFPIVLPWILVVILITHSGREVLKSRAEMPGANPGQGGP